MMYESIVKYTDENGVLCENRLFKDASKNAINIATIELRDEVGDYYEYALIINEKGFEEQKKHEINYFKYIKESKDYKDFKYPQVFVMHESNPVTIQSVIEFYDEYKDIELKEIDEKFGDEILLLVIKARDIIKNIPADFKDFV